MTLEIGKKRLTQRLEEAVSGNLDVAFTIVSTAALGASGIVSDSTKWKLGVVVGKSWKFPASWTLLAVGVATILVAAFFAYRKHESRETLVGRLRTMEADRTALHRELDSWQNSTRIIMERLCEAFGKALNATSTDRVSIYRHIGNKRFERMSRHSTNPKFQESGRVHYPDHEGVVGKAWTDVTATEFVTKAQCPNDRQWANEMATRSGIGKRDLRAMAMKSRSLLAIRIDDAMTHQPCAVLVFESTLEKAELDARCAQLDAEVPSIEDRFRSIVEMHLGEALSDAVGILSHHRLQIDPGRASKEGF